MFHLPTSEHVNTEKHIDIVTESNAIKTDTNVCNTNNTGICTKKDEQQHKTINQPKKKSQLKRLYNNHIISKLASWKANKGLLVVITPKNLKCDSE